MYWASKVEVRRHICSDHLYCDTLNSVFRTGLSDGRTLPQSELKNNNWKKRAILLAATAQLVNLPRRYTKLHLEPVIFLVATERESYKVSVNSPVEKCVLKMLI